MHLVCPRTTNPLEHVNAIFRTGFEMCNSSNEPNAIFYIEFGMAPLIYTSTAFLLFSDYREENWIAS